MWRQLDAHKMVRSCTLAKKGCHATWKLNPHAPTTDDRTFTTPTPPLPPPPPPPPPPHHPRPSLFLYYVYTKGPADLNSNGLSRVLMLADDGLIYKTASDISTAVTAVQEQLEKVSHWCQESEINPSKKQAL